MLTILAGGQPVQAGEAHTILEEYEHYILCLAHRLVPRSLIPLDMLSIEIDELAQATRVKLWLALHQGQITRLKPYIRSIMYHECVDMVRRYKKVSSLSIDEDALDARQLLAPYSEGIQDPVILYEHREAITNSLLQAVQAIFALPPRQRSAMICMLKKQVTDLHQLMDIIFLAYGLDIRALTWPEEKAEQQRLHALVSVARRKLRSIQSEWAS